MQIHLPIENLAQPANSGAPAPRLEKTGATESFDHYLGAGEAQGTKAPKAKTADTHEPAQASREEAKTRKTKDRQETNLLPVLPTLNQPVSDLPLPSLPMGDAAVEPDETTETGSLAPASPTSVPPSAVLGTSAKGDIRGTLAVPPQPSTATRPIARGPLDLPLPSSATGQETASSEPSLFPAPDAPAPVAVADAAALQQVDQTVPTATTSPTNSTVLDPAANPTALAAQAPMAAAPALPQETPKHQGVADQNSSQEEAEELPPLQISSAVSVQLPRSGTGAAMERSTMSDALLHRQAKAKAAGFTASEKIPFATATGKTSSSAVAASASPRLLENAPSGTLSTEATSPVAGAMGSAQQMTNGPETSAAPKVAAMPPSAAVVLDHVQEMTEHLHTSGHRTMELEVQLEGDQRLTISLHMEKGELKTIFKTDSTELRDALAQNWGQVAEKNDRSVRFNPPVFESPSTQSGFMNDPRQQGRQERAFSENGEGQRFTFLAPTAAPPATVSRSTPANPAPGLALYA